MIKFQSKISKVLATTVVLSTILAGCGGQQKASTTSAKPTSAKPVTLTMLVAETSDTPGFEAVVKQIDEKLHIKTKVERRPGGPDGENIVKTRLATGDMADLSVFNSGSLLQTLHPDQNFVDLTNEPFMKNVMKSFKDTVSLNGKVYGVPVSSSQVGGWLYNKKIYKELGLSVPKTWAELMENNKKIKAAGKTAVIGSYATNWTAQLIILADYYNVQKADPNFAKDYTAGKAKYATTPAALKGFEKLSEVKDYMNKDYNTTTYDQAMKMLADGQGVQYPMLTQVLPIIASKYPNAINDIGVFPQPSDSPDVNGFTAWMPNTILINKKIDSSKLEAAKKWLEYYISPEGIAAYESASKAIGPFVINGVKVSDDAYPAVKEMMPYVQSGKMANALEFSTPVKGPNLPQISTEVGGGMAKALKGAQDYDQDVEKQAKQLGLKGW